MKFKVSGSNRTTGARMAMELEAESKGAAERKGREAGMDVHSVQDISDGAAAAAPEGPASPRRSGTTSGGQRMILIILIILLIALVWRYWPQIRNLID